MAKAASLGALPMSMVMGVGAPWYTSGTHIWKGTTPNLNARPATRKTVPKTRAARLATSPTATRRASSLMSSVPVAP